MREVNRGGGDSAKSKYSMGSEEASIENSQGLGTGTENRRSKRRKVKASTTKSANVKAEAINYSWIRFGSSKPNVFYIWWQLDSNSSVYVVSDHWKTNTRHYI